MLTKYLVAVIAALGLALCGLGLLYRSEVRSAAETKQALGIASKALGRVEEQRKADTRTLVARSALIAVQGRKLADANVRLSAALNNNLAWATQPVPLDIQEALNAAD